MLRNTQVPETKRTPKLIFRDPKQEVHFNQRNASLLGHVADLNDAVRLIFGAVSTSTLQERVVFSLGVRCHADFIRVGLLASNGMGFGALQALRGMIEKYVDAEYIHQCPTKVDEFWEYHLVQLKKDGQIDTLNSLEKDWESRIEKYETKRGKYRQRWNNLDLASQARALGLESLTNINRISNRFVHTSVEEILLTSEVKPSGLSVLSVGPSDIEIRYADEAFKLSWSLLILALQLQVDHFHLNTLDHLLLPLTKVL